MTPYLNTNITMLSPAAEFAFEIAAQFANYRKGKRIATEDIFYALLKIDDLEFFVSEGYIKDRRDLLGKISDEVRNFSIFLKSIPLYCKNLRRDLRNRLLEKSQNSQTKYLFPDLHDVLYMTFLKSLEQYRQQNHFPKIGLLDLFLWTIRDKNPVIDGLLHDFKIDSPKLIEITEKYLNIHNQSKVSPPKNKNQEVSDPIVLNSTSENKPSKLESHKQEEMNAAYEKFDNMVNSIIRSYPKFRIKDMYGELKAIFQELLLTEKSWQNCCQKRLLAQYYLLLGKIALLINNNNFSVYFWNSVNNLLNSNDIQILHNTIKTILALLFDYHKFNELDEMITTIQLDPEKYSVDEAFSDYLNKSKMVNP